MSKRSAAVEGGAGTGCGGDGVVVRAVVVAQKDLADRARGIKAHDDVVADILQREIRREPSAIGNLAGRPVTGVTPVTGSIRDPYPAGPGGNIRHRAEGDLGISEVSRRKRRGRQSVS